MNFFSEIPWWVYAIAGYILLQSITLGFHESLLESAIPNKNARKIYALLGLVWVLFLVALLIAILMIVVKLLRLFVIAITAPFQWAYPYMHKAGDRFSERTETPITKFVNWLERS